MKRPTIANDSMVSLYSGRSYMAQSPKTSLNNYSKPFGFSFNSPKGEGQKSLVYNQSKVNSSVRIPTKPETGDLTLERKNSKLTSESFTRSPATISTYLNQASSSSRQAKARGTSIRTTGVEKVRAEPIEFNTKSYNGLVYPESVNQRDSKSKNLEISTDIQTFKGAGSLKAYSTKNNSSKTALGNGAGQQSFDYSLKYPTNQSTTLKYEVMRTDPDKDKKSLTPTTKPKNALSRILSNTTDKTANSATLRKVQQYDDDEDDAYFQTSSPQNSTKINNFFASAKRKELENSLAKKDKSLVLSSKNEQSGSLTQKGEKAQTASSTIKKSPTGTTLDYKSTYKAYPDDSQDDIKRNEDSKNLNLSTTQNKPATPQKASLNSFITKIEKGSALPIKAKRDDSDSTASTNQSKTITFSKNKLNQQALASSSQESAKTKGRPTGGVSPFKKSASREYQDQSEIETASKDSSFTYYVTSLEKHHRKWNESDYFCQIYKEHFIQTFQALTFCKYLKNVDPKILAQKKVFLPKRATHKDKKTIIFDLDETLIHCNESAEIPCDVVLPIRFPHGEIIEAGINIRPYAVEILKEISKDFEIIIFTASHSCYANVVLDYLDPHNQYISHRLFRENCVVTDEGIYIKDLRILGNRSLQDCVLVDNAAYSFGYQVENGIPCIPFYDNKDDTELLHLIPYLRALGNVKDVREVNRQTFKFQNYPMYDSLDKVLNKVVFQN